MTEPICPVCGCEMEYDEVDISVGTQRGPAACRNCYDFNQLELKAERVVTMRETFDIGFRAGLSKAGLTETSDAAYKAWIWSREKP